MFYSQLNKILLTLCVLLLGCSGLEHSENQKLKDKNETHEHIYRLSNEHRYKIPAIQAKKKISYPWDEKLVGNHPRVTKEYFRCQGKGSLPKEEIDTAGNKQFVFDCSGNHSLPIKDGQEYIYPALLEILNYIQEKTGKKVIITCGHRCPAHNSYADNSTLGRTSKHMIGAEVDFYVQGMENEPQKIVDLIQQYYLTHPVLSKDKSLTKFERFDKECNVSTQPWFNKEIFIKLCKASECRDLDNSHSYPYVCIQLKYDRDAKARVTYSWKDAFQGYMRY